MSTRTSDSQVLDVIDAGTKNATDVVWDVQIDQTSALSVQADGTAKQGANLNLSSPTLMVVEEITQENYDLLVTPVATTLYVIPV